MLADFRDVDVRLWRLGRGFLSVATIYDVPADVTDEQVRAAVRGYTSTPGADQVAYPLRIDWPTLSAVAVEAAPR